MVELTKAAIEALEAGVRLELESAIDARHIYQREEFAERHGADEAQAKRDRQQRVLLACADVLGSLRSVRLDFRDFDHTIPAEKRPETVEVGFTPEATEWLEELRGKTEGYLEAMEATSTEGDLDHVREQAFLLRTLDRLVGGREAVAA